MAQQNTVFKNVSLEELGETVQAAEDAVLALLKEEDRIDELMEEIGALDSSIDRLEEGGVLWMECHAFISRCKAISETAKNASKRVEEVKGKLGSHFKKELGTYEDKKVQTKSWKFSERTNPAKVDVVDRTQIPKKYLKDPGPKPPVEEWDVNKNEIKRVLDKKIVGKIPGVQLKSSTRVDVKSR